MLTEPTTPPSDPPGDVSSRVPPPPEQSPEQSAERSAQQPFAGPRRRLDRVGRVLPGTVVVIFDQDLPPQAKLAGELLIPTWLPFRHGAEAMVVRTEPVTVSVAVEQLLTLDGVNLTGVVLEVEVRLVASAVAGLVSEYGADFGSLILDDLRRNLDSSVRAAVGMNRSDDLQRQTLDRVLHDRWLPTSFIRGALVRESFRVRQLRGPTLGPDDEGTPAEGDTLEGPVEGRPVTRPATTTDLRIGSLSLDRRFGRQRSATDALRLVYVPAIISVTVFWMFFIVYWVPEFESFPGARFVLEQLAPLDSKELTSQSQAVVGSQQGHISVPAGFLLLASLLLPPLARSRWWLARLALWPVTYLAAIGAAVTVLSIAARGDLATNFLGSVLLVVWVVAAVTTTWRSLWVDIDTLPRRPAQVWWLLAVFALVNPAPVALGRRVFAPELRTAAVSVLHNDLTLRWAALLTPATALVYLSGLLLGVLVWCAYLLWPPRRTARLSVTVTILAVCLVSLAFVGPAAHRAGVRQAAVISTQSPSDSVSFTCGSWVQRLPGRPARTLVVTGLSCKRVTSFSGYHEVATRETPDSLSPVSADTPAGSRIETKLVGAQYGDVVVLAATNRIDNHVSDIVALRLADAGELWRFSCAPNDSGADPMTLRFANPEAPDDPAAGRLTLPGEAAKIVVGCESGEVGLDPQTGRQL